jgi:hypothetical protein
MPSSSSRQNRDELPEPEKPPPDEPKLVFDPPELRAADFARSAARCRFVPEV